MIDKKNVEDVLALTTMQEGMLFHYLKAPAGRQYVEQLELQLSGNVDPAIFEMVWNTVVENNEMLRVVFRWEKLNMPVQIILKQHKVQFTYCDFSDQQEADSKRAVKEAREADKQRGFNLQEVAFRITLLKTADRKYSLLISNHHILFDGWSTGIILKEFFETYDQLYFKREPHRPTKNKFREFIHAVRNFDQSKHKAYWTNYLKGFDAATGLPFTGKPKQKDAGFKNHKLILDARANDQVNNCLSRNKLTLASLIYTAWGTVLSKCTNTRDVVFGIVVSGRAIQLNNLQDVVGLFINTVPLRLNFIPGINALSLMQEVTQQTRQLAEYEHTPLPTIKSCTELGAQEQLFNSLVVIENYPLDKVVDKLESLSIDAYSMDELTSYDLTLTVNNRESTELEFKYNAAVLSDNDIRRLSDYFLTALTAIGSEPEMPVAKLNILTAAEKQALLVKFNDTRLDYPKNKTLVDLVEEQVEISPDSIALLTEHASLTYLQLNEHANQLAAYLLKNYALKADHLIGVKLQRDEWMLISLLAVLKTGAAYVPIDMGYPEERINYIIADSNCKLVIDAEELLKFKQQSGAYKKANLKLAIAPENLAYVIYTSGSTGMPKGVMITHSNSASFIYWCKKEFEAADFDVVFAGTSICFDLSVYEIFYTLSCGKKIRLLPNSLAIAQYLNTCERILLNTVPSVIGALLSQQADFSAVTVLNMAGEPIPQSHIDQLDTSRVEVRNLYGPSEDTTYSTVYRIKDKNICIGHPISNTRVYITDSDGALAPVGVPGELCLAGDGLARGYLNRPELTAEKFVFNHFENSGRLYKTGDLARWLPDGTIDYLGRMDEQVKIRGYRIELGEIEAVLQKQELIHKAVVVAKGEDAGKYLCAYYTCPELLLPANLKAYLSGKLPEYMLPNYFIQVKEIPLTPNGKVNKKALPDPEMITGEHVLPANETEAKLLEIWSEVLGMEKADLSTSADFFELGGHSLKATLLAAKIHKELDAVISITDLFENSTIRDVAAFIETRVNYKENTFLSIPKAEIKSHYQLSPGQKRLYILQQLNPESIGYNMPALFTLSEGIEKDKLEVAFKKLIARHDGLRTSFQLANEVPAQLIHETVAFRLSVYDCSQAELEQLHHDFYRPFNLEQAPLFRAAYVRVTDGPDCLLIDMHHIITDGVSLQVLEEEFWKLYHGVGLPDVKLQYKDYSEWLNSIAQQERIKQQEKYWLNVFAEEPAVLELPYDQARPDVLSSDGATMRFQLTEIEYAAIKKISKEADVTLYMCLLSLITVLFSKLGNQADIVIGTPVAARRHADLEGIIGMFVNTLPIRMYPSGKKTYETFLEEVKQQTLLAYENQEYAFEDLVNKLNVTRNSSRNPLFDVLFVLQNQSAKSPAGYQPKVQSKFDISIEAIETSSALEINLTYCTQLFNEATIHRFIAYLKNIIRAVASQTQVTLDDLQILPEEEQHQLIIDFNKTALTYPKDKTLVTLFEAQVEKTPAAVALIYGASALTYATLNECANQVAAYLRKVYKVKRDDLIGLQLGRSEDMLIALLGILKSGAAYVPIDPDYPQERIDYMIADSKCKLLINEALMAKFKNGPVDDHNETILPVNHPADLAYVMYTSGSTGNPKGVMVTHGNVINLAFAQKNTFNIQEQERILQFTTICFDASVEQIWIALLSGAALVLVSKETLLDKGKFENFLITNAITHLHAVPAFLNTLDIPEPNSLKRIIAGGDVCTAALAAKYYRQYDFYNEYGPTETTVTSTELRVKSIPEYKHKGLSIGRPVANTQVFILSEGLNLQPVGVAGELCVAGDGLARGYLNRPNLTAEKFITHPFNAGERMYRTGDLARWMPDGTIEYLGRLDEQVKIRGYRIEPEEIAQAVKKYQTIADAVAIVRGSNGAEKTLAVYYTAAAEIDKTSLREYLSGKLPEYMVPAYFMQLENLPLLPNGKLNKKALPDPDSVMGTYKAPANETEHQLAALWAGVLGINQELIGTMDNFFTLGGHSLKATVLIAKIHQQLNVKLPLTLFFSKPTIQHTATYIQNVSGTKHENFRTLVKAEQKSHYHLSPGQKRLYILQQMDPEGIGYNMPVLLPISKMPDKHKLELAIKKLIARHESLRTSFELFQDEPMQKIHEAVVFELPEYNCASSEPATVLPGFTRPFNLEAAPLLHAAYLKVEGAAYLLLDMHHIITDGISQQILEAELWHIYNGVELPVLNLQYKDYSEWLNSPAQQEQLQKQRSYWLNNLHGELPVLELPYDFNRPQTQSFEGATTGFALSGTAYATLQSLCRRNEITLYMCLTGIINIWLAKLSNQDDIIIGSPIAARRHTDLEGIIGMFVNTLAIRNHPSGEKTVDTFLQEVKQNTLLAYENQEYAFEELVNELKINRDLSRNPLFDMLVVLQNQSEAKTQQIDFTSGKGTLHVKTQSKFDLTLEAYETSDTLWINIEYCTQLFKEETIDRFIDYFKNTIKAIATGTHQKIKDLEIISASEKQQLLVELNNNHLTYPEDKTLVNLFEEQVKKTPQAIALVFGNTSLTYSDLNEKANQLADHLMQTYATQPEDLIGIKLERSEWMVISILAILKSGAAYVPIDPEYPQERINYILTDSACKAVIDDKALEIFNADKNKYDKTNPVAAARPENLAYVIYTSGSTGYPKGVLIEHGNILSRIMAETALLQLPTEIISCLTTNYIFDVSLLELFLPLATGGRIIVPGKEQISAPEALIELLSTQQVNVLQGTPVFMNYFLLGAGKEKLRLLENNLKHLCIGGESLPEHLVCDLKNVLPYTTINNHYGPTETTVDALVLTNVVKPLKNSIGYPLANTQIYILSTQHTLLPIGVTGEICIGGDGVARGYMNRPDLTIEKFIANPFKAGERLYKTGDIGRWLPDGTVEFLGRMDDQVKIRGHRIELGEIETTLRQHPLIDIAIVVAKVKAAATEKYLCAYYVATTPLSATRLREYLSEKIPDYMIPAYFMAIREIPLTPSGKVDKKQLPDPEITATNNYVAPGNKIEEQLVELWSELLELKPAIISVDANFFELGGHSLKATVLAAKIHKVFEIKVPLAEIFKTPSIRGIGEYISALQILKNKTEQKQVKSLLKI